MTAPYYSDDLVQLFHGDCREVTDWLTADVLCTDPPYGRAWKQGNLHGRDQVANDHTGIANDLDPGVRDEVLAMWGDRVAIVFGDLMLPPPSGTKLVCVYRKPPNAGTRGAIAGRRRDAEAVYLVGPWPSGLGGVSSILETAARMQGGATSCQSRYGHPHAKPLDVMHELITLAPPADVIADPFAGAGSTLVAAQLAGRRAIGVELEEAYCERAARRLSQGGFAFDAEPAS